MLSRPRRSIAWLLPLNSPLKSCYFFFELAKFFLMLVLFEEKLGKGSAHSPSDPIH